MPTGLLSGSGPLAGRLILVVEDEPLVALDLRRILRVAGARVISAGHVESGLFTTEHPDLSAAVVDLHLGQNGNGAAVGRRLRQLRVPFVIYTGYPSVLITSQWPDVSVLRKPADAGLVVDALARLVN
jgi:ActR/RegA family two-component response regulator